MYKRFFKRAIDITASAGTLLVLALPLAAVTVWLHYSPEQARRHEIRPGITGWAQINGRNAISWGKRFELDVWYVDNVSFATDCKIVLETVRKVFKREGISSETSATMEAFKGNN